MSDRLPERVDPLFLIRTKKRFQGALPLSQLARLKDALLNTEGEAHFDLSFRTEGKVPAVVGHVNADLTLQCQVCLKPTQWAVRRIVNLGVVTSIDQALLLPESFEPLLSGNEKMTLTAIVEDELILGIPLIPRHSACEMPVALTEEIEPQEKPFAILAELRKTGEK